MIHSENERGKTVEGIQFVYMIQFVRNCSMGSQNWWKL